MEGRKQREIAPGQVYQDLTNGRRIRVCWLEQRAAGLYVWVENLGTRRRNSMRLDRLLPDRKLYKLAKGNTDAKPAR